MVLKLIILMIINLRKTLKENDIKPAWFARQIGRDKNTVYGWIENGLSTASRASITKVIKWFRDHNFPMY